MADEPTSPGTNGEGRPGEDGADAPADGMDASADGADVPADDVEVPGEGVDGEESGDGAVAEPGRGRAAAVDASGPGPEASSPDGRDGVSAQGDGSPVDGSPDVPTDVRKYERFTKVDGAQYDRVNEFLRERTYVTAREWAMARLCADFRTETGVEMTKIGENLPELVPFMEDTYSPQAVNQARSSFEDKVHKAGATFLYGAMCDFFTAEELDELMYEVTEVAKFLLEVEGIDLTVEEELEAEDRISGIMREVREASEALRYEECPHCGEHLRE